MRENDIRISTKENIIDGINGWAMLTILLIIAGFGVYLIAPPLGLPSVISGTFLCTEVLFCFNGMLPLSQTR